MTPWQKRKVELFERDYAEAVEEERLALELAEIAELKELNAELQREVAAALLPAKRRDQLPPGRSQ